jgi:hypothetical protein
VVVDKTRFLNSEERVGVPLPPLAPGPCTTVVFLGPRGLSFRVDLPEGGEDDGVQHVPSAGGVASFQRCDEAAVSGDGTPAASSWPGRKLALLVGESGRGAVETIVARSAGPLPALRTLLPERSEGRASPQPEPGPLPPLPSPEKRADVSETRERRDGATVDRRVTWRAGSDGKGAEEMTLAPGCHTLVLFAPEPAAPHGPRRGRLDLDAELRDAADDSLLARDQTDAPDARLSTCVAEPTRVGALFVGAPAGGSVLVSHAVRSLPSHLPTLWGGEVRARMAQALLARHVAALSSDPVALAQGGPGSVPVPLPLEPGACYLAVAALVQGASSGIGLTARVDHVEAVDARSADETGAVVAFCAGTAKSGVLEAETRGAPLLSWGLAVYRIQNGIWAVP